MIFTSISFSLWFRWLTVALVCLSSLCGVVCLFRFVQVFVRFNLSHQLQSMRIHSMTLVDVNVADLESNFRGYNTFFLLTFCCQAKWILTSDIILFYLSATYWAIFFLSIWRIMRSSFDTYVFWGKYCHTVYNNFIIE